MRKFGPLMVLFAVIVALTAPVTSLAGTSVGDFEIDGDTVDSPAGGAIDWDTPPPNLVTFTDGTGQTDDTFGSGSKENVPDEWDFVLGSVPGKTDLTSGAFAFREIGGETFVYMNFTRATRNGDTFSNFEFNQSRNTFVNSSGDAVPVRTAGDLLVAFFVVNGGKELNLDLRSWVGDRFSGVWQSLGSGTMGADWDADVNDDSNGRWDFAEVAVNFSAFGFVPSCPGIGKAWIKTTTSASFETAALADHTAQQDVNLSTCATKSWEFTVHPTPISGTKVFAVYTLPSGEGRDLELVDPDHDGTFTGADGEIPAGTVTFHFEIRNDLDGDGVFDDVVWAGPVGTETFVERESKTNTGEMTYEVLLSPESAENFAGRPHTLTATVREVGTNVPLVGVTVHFAIDPPGCGTLSPASSITDASGQATTTLTSAAGCTTGVRAWVDGAYGTAAFEAGEANDTASKVFVAYSLTITPTGAINVSGSNHTFTVTLFRNTGSGPVGYADQTLTLTLDPGGGDAHLVSINGEPASGTEGTCTTRTDGTCEVVITATTPGLVTLTASFTTINDSGEGTFTSSGDKSFVDYRVRVSPTEAENVIGRPHTLIVTVERDSGSGFTGVSGIEVTLTLDPGDSDAHLVSINGEPASGTTGTCVTRADGTCEVVIVATTPGTATLTASIDVALDSGTLVREGSGTKLYSDFRIAVTPGSATNEVGQPHTFTVTLQRDDGAGFTGFGGQTVTLTLDPDATDAHFVTINGEPASGTTGTCVTDAAGTCEVVIVSTTPGSVTLTAEWQGEIGSSSVERSAQASKTYVMVEILKAACPSGTTTPGGHLDYSISFRTEGADIHGASLVDHLPAEFRYESASPSPTSAPAPGSSGDVVWDLRTLAAGSDLTFTISGSVSASTASGTTIMNVAVLDGDEIAPKTATVFTLITNAGAAASGRAFGISAKGLANTVYMNPTPDTDFTNPGEFLGVHVLAPTLDVGVLNVSNNSDVDGEATDTAIATAVNVSVDAGGVTLRARTVVARSSSSANASSATSSRSGSTIQDLVINGTKYADIHEPVTIPVKVGGDLIAEVRVLETTGTGAAGGVEQPDAGFFSSGMAVNGIHVIIHDLAATELIDESFDLIVSHADSAATYPSGLACGAEPSSVAGDASLLEVFNLTPDLGSIETGLVTLPSTGGSDDAAVADTTPLGIVTGNTHTEGTLDPLAAASSATVSSIDLLDGTITATTVRAVSATDGSSTGSAIIEDLDIAGTDVCSALGLEAICVPDPDTVLLLDDDNVIVLLNEQIGGDGLRVNAVHIFVIGRDNPLDLPVGAEIIVSSAFSDTSA